MNLYFVFAMKRSGHHAFINWMKENLNSGCHINNAIDGWEVGECNCPQSAGGKVETWGSEPNSNLIISVEDFDISDWKKFKFFEFVKYKQANNIYPILFLRDFKNWLSSSIQRKKGNYGLDVYDFLDIEYLNDRKEKKSGRIDLWRKQLNEFINPTIPNLIPVSHFNWISFCEYRKRLSEKLNITNLDQSMKTISSEGKGSSFGDLGENQFDFFNRYKLLQDDSDYISLTNKYSDLVQLSKEYIGV